MLTHFLHLPGPTCKQLIDPSKAYKSAAFEVSEEELVFGGGGYKKMLAADNEKTKKRLVESDEDEDLPDAGSLMSDIGESKHDVVKVRTRTVFC